MVSTKVEVRLILMNMVYVSVTLVVNYCEAERKNRAPCAGLHETYLTNGWQAKQNCPDLKAVDARTFGRVIKTFSLISRKSNEEVKKGSLLIFFRLVNGQNSTNPTI